MNMEKRLTYKQELTIQKLINAYKQREINELKEEREVNQISRKNRNLREI